MQNCPRQLAMQSCVLCSFVRCNQIKLKNLKNSYVIFYRFPSFVNFSTMLAGRKFVYHGQIINLLSPVQSDELCLKHSQEQSYNFHLTNAQLYDNVPQFYACLKVSHKRKHSPAILLTVFRFFL